MVCASPFSILFELSPEEFIPEMEPATMKVIYYRHPKVYELLIIVVEFRMIMFRPVEGEVLLGKVLSSNKNGIRVSLEFTEDVWIPSYNCSSFFVYYYNLCVVQEGSVYDPVKRIWIWRYNDGDQQLDFEVDTGELIRFRVVALQYNRIESTFLQT